MALSISFKLEDLNSVNILRLWPFSRCCSDHFLGALQKNNVQKWAVRQMGYSLVMQHRIIYKHRPNIGKYLVPAAKFKLRKAIAP